MVLVDTSVWIDHLRQNDQQLASLLHSGRVCIHSHVLGEIALGSLKNRRSIIELLSSLPFVPLGTETEVLTFIEAHGLYSRGIGYVDSHLLASTILNRGTKLWTRDKRLFAIAKEMNLQFEWD